MYTILENKKIAPEVFRMRLAGDTAKITAPGQFVNIRVPGFYLRRPISIADWDGTGLTVIYKMVGEGTKRLGGMNAGEQLDLLTGLGNGYNLSAGGNRPLLIGGGVGIPPLYGLAKALLRSGVQPAVILGFNTQREIFLRDEFEKMNLQTIVTTVDGSFGVRGFVTDAMEGLDYDYFYTCGPEKMLRAVSLRAPTSGQLSFEERMACGFGACMGCSCQTKYGSKRICKDGPVLTKEEVIW